MYVFNVMVLCCAVVMLIVGCVLCLRLSLFDLHSCTFRLQKIVKEALGRPAKEITHTASFFAEIFTRVTVVS